MATKSNNSGNNKHISIQETTWIDISVPPELKEEFKHMVTRAMNTWQNPSEAMVRFTDRLLGQEKIMAATYKPEAPEPLYEDTPLPVCKNHPETCNCPIHCG